MRKFALLEREEAFKATRNIIFKGKNVELPCAQLSKHYATKKYGGAEVKLHYS
jgi:hypothetical protein